MSASHRHAVGSSLSFGIDHVGHCCPVSLSGFTLGVLGVLAMIPGGAVRLHNRF